MEFKILTQMKLSYESKQNFMELDDHEAQLLAEINQALQLLQTDVSSSNLIDGCKLCKHNENGIESGSFCVNNCISGNKFEAKSNLQKYLVRYTELVEAPHALLDDEIVIRAKVVEVSNPIEINDLIKNVVDIKQIF